jgi:gas vesicle protein
MIPAAVSGYYGTQRYSMTEEDANEFVAGGEYEPSGRNTVAIGLALLLIGFAAGAIAAALMTPKTGKQMRRSLKRKLDDARDSMGDLREQAGDWVDKGSDLADKASDWADKAKERVAPLVEKFRS